MQPNSQEPSLRNSIHKTSIQEYPEAKQLTLPSNIEEIASTEKLQFSPQRNRDISGSFLTSMSSENVEAKTQKNASVKDDRVASYDCSNAVNLSSSMQTNVPDPFKSKGKATHLNMPGGQWSRGEKYMSEDLNNAHPINTRNTRTVQSGGSLFQKTHNKRTSSYLMDKNTDNLWLNFLMFQPKNFYSTGEGEKKNEIEAKGEGNLGESDKKLTVRQKLKLAIKDYGSVALVFHISISLISLGICFLIVYRLIYFFIKLYKKACNLLWKWFITHFEKISQEVFISFFVLQRDRLIPIHAKLGKYRRSSCSRSCSTIRRSLCHT